MWQSTQQKMYWIDKQNVYLPEIVPNTGIGKMNEYWVE